MTFIHKDISYVSRVIADFVLNFVAMATQLALMIGPRILHQIGGLGGWPINRSHSNLR